MPSSRIIRTSEGGVPVHQWYRIINADPMLAFDLVMQYERAEQYWYDEDQKARGEATLPLNRLTNRYHAQNCKNFAKAVHQNYLPTQSVEQFRRRYAVLDYPQVNVDFDRLGRCSHCKLIVPLVGRRNPTDLAALHYDTFGDACEGGAQSALTDNLYSRTWE